MATYPEIQDLYPTFPDVPFAGPFPRLRTRYFTQLPGVDQYFQLASAVVLSGVTSISFDMLTTLTTSAQYIMDSPSDGTNRMFCLLGGPTFSLPSGITATVDGQSNFTDPRDGVLHRVVLSGDMTGLRIGFFGRRFNGTEHFQGIIANVQITQAGTLTNSWALDANSFTQTDSVGGNTATYTNGDLSDIGLFNEQASGEWLGQELVVNGGFDTDLSGWTLSVGNTWVWNNSTALHVGPSSNLRSASMVLGRMHRVNLNVGIASGSITAFIGLGNPQSPMTATGNYIFNGLAMTDGTLYLDDLTDNSLNYVDTASIKQVLNVA